MKSPSSRLLNCSSEILLLVLEHLSDDPVTLCSLGLVCKFLRRLSIQFLLRNVNLASHNNGRLPEQEDDIRGEIYAHHDADLAPPNLLSRQRAFLRLIVTWPHLALHVQSFTWTLIWAGEGNNLSEIEFQLWHIFSQLINVRHLDLASLHSVTEEPYVRNNPPRLFPAVTQLRLLGWMHRGLFEAIVNALNPTGLQTVILDYLEDEGAFPNGAPMSEGFARMHAPHRPGHVPHDVNYRGSISEQLYKRQRIGHAAVFPGPMWSALHLLANRQCTSLKKFVLTMSPFKGCVDLRNYITCFDEAARFLQTVQRTLMSLTIVFGADPLLYEEYTGGCGTARLIRHRSRAWHITLATYLLDKLLAVLSRADFPSLEIVKFQGFQVIGIDEYNRLVHHVYDFNGHIAPILWQALPEEADVEAHPVFEGYYYNPDEETSREFSELAAQS